MSNLPKHGGDIYTAENTLCGPVLDFSANVNPLGVPPLVQKKLQENIAQCAVYPDPRCRALCHAIAQDEGVAFSQVLCGNGAADLIFRLVYALRPKQGMVLAPTFCEYEQALSAFGAKTEYHLLKEERGFVLGEDILEDIHSGLDLLFLCNPNNPTGELTEPSLLHRILKKCRACGVTLLLDECFLDLTEQGERCTLKPLISEYKNLVVLKAFTKLYALPGLRLGYCLSGSEELLKKMCEAAQSWSVSTLAQLAGQAALADGAYRQKTKELISAQRAYLTHKLKKLGAVVYGSRANFVFFQLPGVTTLFEQLLERGILIRSCENFYPLEGGFYRVAVRLQVENERLIAAIGGCVKTGGA